MNIRGLNKWALLPVFWMAQVVAPLHAQLLGPYGTSPITFGVDSNALLYATGTYGTGNLSSFTGAGTRMLWYPGKAAFRAGYVNGTQWNDANVGAYSVALGSNNIAVGQGSFVTGENNYAYGADSFVAGYNNNIVGDGNTPPSQGATVFGANNGCFGPGSFVCGWGNNAGPYSFVAGCGNYAWSGDSFVGGGNSTASGGQAVALGYYVTASGGHSAAFNFLTTASGNDAAAFGGGTLAAGNGSASFGYNTTATAFNSVVLGTYNVGKKADGTAASATTWVATDPLFEIGNGGCWNGQGNPNKSAPADALVVYKNGNAAIQGTLQISAGGDIPMFAGY